jgi:hypothetical protein
MGMGMGMGMGMEMKGLVVIITRTIFAKCVLRRIFIFEFFYLYSL